MFEIWYSLPHLLGYGAERNALLKPFSRAIKFSVVGALSYFKLPNNHTLTIIYRIHAMDSRHEFIKCIPCMDLLDSYHWIQRIHWITLIHTMDSYQAMHGFIGFIPWVH